MNTQDRPWWPQYLMSTRTEDTRPCTCHPDDNPPQPCPKLYALSDCREADRVWSNEVLRLIQRHAPHIPMSEHGDESRRTFMAFARSVCALGTADPVARHLAAGIADHWRDGLLAALPFVRHYAEKNPRRLYQGEWQDPSGVHAWMARYDPKTAKTPCGECSLMPGERCDICGVTAPDNR